MLQIFFEATPTICLALTSPVQPFQRQSQSHSVVSIKCRNVSADTVVLIVSSKFCFQGWPPIFRFGRIPHGLQPSVHLLALLTKLHSTGCPTDYELPLSAFPAIVRESQKVEGVRLPVLLFRIPPLIPAKTDHARFVRM